MFVVPSGPMMTRANGLRVIEDAAHAIPARYGDQVIGTIGDDSWAGYATERTEIANFLRDNRIKNLVIFAGDTVVGGKQNRIINVSVWLPAAIWLNAWCGSFPVSLRGNASTK